MSSLLTAGTTLFIKDNISLNCPYSQSAKLRLRAQFQDQACPFHEPTELTIPPLSLSKEKMRGNNTLKHLLSAHISSQNTMDLPSPTRQPIPSLNKLDTTF